MTIPFHFGENSFRKHQAEIIRHSGEAAYVHFDASIAADIDTPHDLALLNSTIGCSAQRAASDLGQTQARSFVPNLPTDPGFLRVDSSEASRPG